MRQELRSLGMRQQLHQPIRQAMKQDWTAPARDQQRRYIHAARLVRPHRREPRAQQFDEVGTHLLESRRKEPAMDIAAQYSGAEMPHARFHVIALESRRLVSEALVI